jgi:hypothetical protein
MKMKRRCYRKRRSKGKKKLVKSYVEEVEEKAGDKK